MQCNIIFVKGIEFGVLPVYCSSLQSPTTVLTYTSIPPSSVSVSLLLSLLLSYLILSSLPFPSPFLCYVMFCSVQLCSVSFSSFMFCSVPDPSTLLPSLLLFCFVLYPFYSDLFSSHLICRILLCPDHFHYNMFYRDLKTKLICPAFALSYTDAHCYIRLSHVTECHRL